MYQKDIIVQLRASNAQIKQYLDYGNHNENT